MVKAERRLGDDHDGIQDGTHLIQTKRHDWSANFE